MLQPVQAERTNAIVEYSSGSTVISMGILARVLHNIHNVHAYLSNKTSQAKLELLQFFGLKITLFGGPSQPEPSDPRGGIQIAAVQARESALNGGSPGPIFNANQYENNGNWDAHFRWTGPQILKQLPEIGVIGIGMGTSGTMTGTGLYLKTHKPNVMRVAVCTAPGQRVPGPRTKLLMDPVEFPWRDAIDEVEEVSEIDSYRLSMELSREGLICGPSSGLNLQGLYQFLAKKKEDGSLYSLPYEQAGLHCVFLCCDLPYQYIHEYFAKLGPNAFPQIQNEFLAQVDLYRYEEAWEISVEKAIDMLQKYPSIMVVDFRQSADFATKHLDGAIYMPLNGLTSAEPSPYRDARVLAAQWTELNRMFSSDITALDMFKNKKVYLVCYGGDTSRLASSILRARGIEAYSLRGGWARAYESLSL